MAKITFGGIVTDARNKLGDVVYSRNRGGSFARAYVLHNLSNTTLQALFRSRFAILQNHWQSSLTPAQRDAWEKFALTAPLKPKPISHAHLTGHNWFLRLNTVEYSTALFILDDPPLDLSTFDPGGITSATCNVATTQFLIDVPIHNTANNYIGMALTMPLSSNVHVIGPRAAWIVVTPPSSTWPVNIWTQYTTYRTTPTAGDRIGLQLWGINANNGMRQATAYPLIITAT